MEIVETFPSIFKYDIRLFTSNHDGGVPQLWAWGLNRGINSGDSSDNPSTRVNIHSTTDPINGYGPYFSITFPGEGIWYVSAFQETPSPDAPNVNFKNGDISIITGNNIVILFSY